MGVHVVAISSDTEAIDKQTYKEWDIDGLPAGFGFPIEEAGEWGLFVSKGIKEEPEMFNKVCYKNYLLKTS